MDSIISALECDRGVNINDGDIIMSPTIKPFIDLCPKTARDDIQKFVSTVLSIKSPDEKLLIVAWFENSIERSSLLFIVVRPQETKVDRHRFILSFHAPEYTFYCANSDFRRCMIKDKKWMAFAESLIGLAHGLDG